MKQLIKRIIPGWIKPLVQKVYRIFNHNFSKEQYESLAALKCFIAYNKYGGYCVPESSRHRPAAQKVIANDVYEPETIEFIISNCGDGDIVHAGTYFGDFLPAISNECATGSKVWAFEPNPESYRCANITLQINNIKNIELTNAGLGAKKECLLMKTSDLDGKALGGASQLIDKELNEISGTETVQIVTVDGTVGADRNISIIQLDVEGHEKEALSGALKTIQRCLPIIILEVLPDSTLLDSDWLSENILSLGYRMTNNIHGNSVFVCEAHNKPPNKLN